MHFALERLPAYQRDAVYHWKLPNNLVIGCHLSPVLSDVRGFVEEVGLCQGSKGWSDFVGGSQEGFQGKETSTSKIAEERSRSDEDNIMIAVF